MFDYNYIFNKLNIVHTAENTKIIKSIITGLIKNGDASIEKQLINVDINNINYLWNIINKLNCYFDYKYNTKKDLTSFIYYIINNSIINFNAIFCPGYTNTGYKDYIGENNSKRLNILKEIKNLFQQEKIPVNFKITLANIFLENTNYDLNPNWKKELNTHEKKFKEKASKNFDETEIIFLSDIYNDSKYTIGYISDNLNKDKNYYNFYKNNIEFYKKMNWSNKEIKKRNDKLYTIYNIISDYIKKQENGVYLPMETMYSRSKVMTKNNVCTMYLRK